LPFLDDLRAGAIGPHADQLPNASLPAAAAPIGLLPLAYGALAMRPPAPIGVPFHDMWVRIGGWYGCAPVFLALYALVPKPRFRSERLLLAAWAALWQARLFGAAGPGRRHRPGAGDGRQTPARS
jgi:hypothetical protein